VYLADAYKQPYARLLHAVGDQTKMFWKLGQHDARLEVGDMDWDASED